MKINHCDRAVEQIFATTILTLEHPFTCLDRTALLRLNSKQTVHLTRKATFPCDLP